MKTLVKNFYPYKISKKIFKKIKFYISKKDYYLGYYTKEQNKIFLKAATYFFHIY